MLKNEKSANRNDHQNRKTDLKNSQNRKTENPNAPLLTTFSGDGFVIKRSTSVSSLSLCVCCVLVVLFMQIHEINTKLSPFPLLYELSK